MASFQAQDLPAAPDSRAAACPGAPAVAAAAPGVLGPQQAAVACPGAPAVAAAAPGVLGPQQAAVACPGAPAVAAAAPGVQGPQQAAAAGPGAPAVIAAAILNTQQGQAAVVQWGAPRGFAEECPVFFSGISVVMVGSEVTGQERSWWAANDRYHRPPPTGDYGLNIISSLGKGGNGTVWHVRRNRQAATATGAVAGFGEPPIAVGSSSASGSSGVGAECDLPQDMALKVAKRYADCQDEYCMKTSQQQHCLIMECGMRREALALYKCRSSSSTCVLKCFARGKVLTSNSEELPCLLLELSPHGSLEDVVRPGNIPVSMSPVSTSDVIKHIIFNLYRVHDHKVIHRDIKASNVLLFGPPSCPMSRLKLADFGSARIMDDIDDLAKTWCAGTPVLRAPEMRAGCRHDTRVDTFMLGMLLLEVRYGYTPFWYLLLPPPAGICSEDCIARFQILYIEILRDDCPYNIDGFIPGWQRLDLLELEFVHTCLKQDCAERPSAAELLGSNYFQARRD